MDCTGYESRRKHENVAADIKRHGLANRVAVKPATLRQHFIVTKDTLLPLCLVSPTLRKLSFIGILLVSVDIFILGLITVL
jgi:hypothetical protein